MTHPMTTSEPILSVRNLSRHFGAIKAVDDVSFDLAQGELLALIGPVPDHRDLCVDDGD